MFRNLGWLVMVNSFLTKMTSVLLTVFWFVQIMLTVRQLRSICSWFLKTASLTTRHFQQYTLLCGRSELVCYTLEPRIRCGNEDSRGNEDQKSRTNLFSMEKIDKHTFFSMKIKMMDLWMQTECTKLIFIMNVSVLHFLKLPPEYLKLQRFWSRLSNFSEGGRGTPRLP